MERMSLKTLCEKLDVSRRIIQGYEEKGLLGPSGKNKYGHLLYDEKAYHRAKMIKFLRQLGFGLNEIKMIIDAPEEVLKEALKRRVEELEIDKDRLIQIIEEANDFIKKL